MTEQPKLGAEVALLLVDGEVIARHVLAEYLQHCGYAVIAAASTEEAVTVLQSPDYIISAVLCALPAVGPQSGFAFAQWVRDHYPAIEIALAGTMDAAAEAAAKFCDQGPRLARPYDPKAIVERVKLMRERGRQKLATVLDLKPVLELCLDLSGASSGHTGRFREPSAQG